MERLILPSKKVSTFQFRINLEKLKILKGVEKFKGKVRE
jgi:hypothetical protein